MENSKKYTLLTVLLIVLFVSCDKGFDELNTDKVRLTEIDPTFQLNHAIVSSAPGYGDNLTYQVTIVRQMATPVPGVGAGANFNLDNPATVSALWNLGYGDIIKNLTDGIYAIEDNPEKTNLLSMLRIYRAHQFMILTDTYGSIPYFDASKGYLEDNSFPKYTPQELIYDDILKELESASATLDPSKDAVSQEVLYSGSQDNILAWKKFGYSLLLRAAMRLTKVNPTKAQEYVEKAISGGVFTSNLDNAVIRHDSSFRNPLGTPLNGGQSAFYYLDKEFVNYLKDNDDPRLAAIAVRYVGALSGNDQIEDNADRNPVNQIGIPQGYNNTTIAPIAEADGVASYYAYSQLDRTRLASPDAPTFILTYSQTLLLYAEAVVRNWVPGDANALYLEAIRANMEQFSEWPGNTTIPEEEIETYLAANELISGKELEQINTQYWVSTFLNGSESWANFRRSGYPLIEPNPFGGSDLTTEDFIRRLTYPDSETTVNLQNMNEAIEQQGPDNLDTRIWWDVKLN